MQALDHIMGRTALVAAAIFMCPALAQAGGSAEPVRVISLAISGETEIGRAHV